LPRLRLFPTWIGCLTLFGTLFGLLGLPGGVPTAQAQWSFSVDRYEEGNQDNIADIDWPYYLNQARCLCDSARGDEEEAYLWYRLTLESGSTGGGEEVLIYVGQDCDSEAVVIDEKCHFVEGFGISSFINDDPAFAIPVNWIVSPEDGVCEEVNAGTNDLYVFVGNTSNEPSATFELPYDTRSPDAPRNVTASGGEQAVELAWDAPEDETGIESYDILCATDGMPAASASPSQASFVSTEALCDQTLTIGDATDVGMAESCASLTGGFVAGERPSDCFVCSSVSASADNVRLEGLENGAVYSFAVVAVDESGNVSVVSDVVDATPQETTDFAERYAEAGGQERGGFCFIATAVYGDYDHPQVRRFRQFRDGVLARSPAGRAFIRWYYRHGRSLALLEGLSPELALVAKLGLRGLAVLTAPAAGTRGAGAGLPLGVFLLGFAVAAANRRRTRRGRRGHHGRREEDHPRHKEETPW
jgi:hypothetical protein